MHTVLSDDPLVSVILPAYNAERTLGEAVDSALAQTYRNLEVIVVDDGSSDGTPAVIRQYAAEPRVRAFRQRNAGPAAARNRGIAEARGEYIAFLDADDLWLPEKIEKQLALFRQNPDLGLVYCLRQNKILDSEGRWIDDANRNRECAVYTYYRGMVFSETVRAVFIALPAVVVPKAVLQRVGGFDAGLVTAEDRHLYARIAHDYPIDYVDEPLVIVRRHGNNLSWDGRVRPQTLDFLRKIAAEFPECSLSSCAWMRRAYAHWAHISGYDNFYAGNMRAARQELWEACRYRPFRLSSWGYLAAACLPKPAIRMLRAAKRCLRR